MPDQATPISADEIVRRTRELLGRAEDPKLPLAHVEAEAKELQRLASERQDWHRQQLAQNEKDQKETEIVLTRLGEAINLRKQAQAAREAGQHEQADRLDAEGKRIAASVPRVSREERLKQLQELRGRLSRLQKESRELGRAGRLTERVKRVIEQRKAAEGQTVARPAEPQNSPAPSSSKGGLWDLCKAGFSVLVDLAVASAPSQATAGGLTLCPHCRGTISSTATTCHHCSRFLNPTPGVGIALCPHCHGAVRTDATVCHHCSRFL